MTESWHDMDGDADRVPYGFHAVPDTDYEFSLYRCEGDRSELWRHLAPGVPRINDWPHQLRGETTTGAVKQARHAVKRNGSVYRYEVAIPKFAISDLKLDNGRAVEAGKRYKVAGWASVNEQQGKPVWDVFAGHLRSGKMQDRRGAGVTLKGVDDNPGIAGQG